jgi:hypothetical protein
MKAGLHESSISVCVFQYAYVGGWELTSSKSGTSMLPVSIVLDACVEVTVQ